MGFGSYDESDRRDPEIATGELDTEDVDLRQHDHEGTASFESGGSTEDLLAGLGRIMDDETEE